MNYFSSNISLVFVLLTAWCWHEFVCVYVCIGKCVCVCVIDNIHARVSVG